VPNVPKHLTAVTLVTIGGLHIAWGRGSSYPLEHRQDLADAVIGARSVPPPSACYAVAAALMIAAGLVEGAPGVPRGLRQTGLAGVVLVLAGRGVLGFAGRTDLVSPGSTSPRFRRLDRRFYSPLCLALSAGALSAGRDRAHQGSAVAGRRGRTS
jgi:Protein of unknown function (DUF3995)